MVSVETMVMTHAQVNFSATLRPEIGPGVLLLEFGLGSVSRVSLVSHMVSVMTMLCMLVFVLCVAPPPHVGAWSMVVLLGQPFEYYYYSYPAKIQPEHDRLSVHWMHLDIIRVHEQGIAWNQG